MAHSTLETESGLVSDFRLYKASNNLDGRDNLDEIPAVEAVYGIFGRINGQPSNCRYVGETSNLQQAIRDHFSDSEPHACLKQFMQSIKIKTINFEPMPGSGPSERLQAKKRWENQYAPDCNEELNKIH